MATGRGRGAYSADGPNAKSGGGVAKWLVPLIVLAVIIALLIILL